MADEEETLENVSETEQTQTLMDFHRFIFRIFQKWRLSKLPPIMGTFKIKILLKMMDLFLSIESITICVHS